MARALLKPRGIKKRTFREQPGKGYQAGKKNPGEKSKITKDSDIVGKTAKLGASGTYREVTRGERNKALSDFQKMKDKNLAASAPKKTSSTTKKTSSAKAGSNVKKRSDTKNYNVGKSKGGVSFGEAFKHFRKKGAKAFTWNGKRYTTATK